MNNSHTVIMGGGLGGLIAAIKLKEAGREGEAHSVLERVRAELDPSHAPAETR